MVNTGGAAVVLSVRPAMGKSIPARTGIMIAIDFLSVPPLVVEQICRPRHVLVNTRYVYSDPCQRWLPIGSVPS